MQKDWPNPDAHFLSELIAAFHTWMIAEADITTRSGAV